MVIDQKSALVQQASRESGLMVARHGKAVAAFGDALRLARKECSLEKS